MQMKKRVLSAFMALCMVCSLVGAAWAVIPQQTSAAANGQFTISWNGNNSITVHLVDETGKQLPIDVDFSSLDKVYDPTHFADKYITNQWVSIEKLAATWASQTEGYTYVGAYRSNVNSNNQIYWLNCRTNTYGQGTRFNEWRYSDQQTAPTRESGGNSWENRDLYLVYNKVTEITPNPNLTISDTVSADGSLTAQYQGTGATYYVWEKSVDGSVWTSISRLKMNGDQYNLSKDGQTLNAALEVVNDVNDSGGQWFRVSAYANQEAYESKQAALATSAAMQLNYYDELRNGSFEQPVVADLSTGNKSNYQYPVGSEDLIWRTTGNDQQIEIVNENGSSASSDYHNSDGAQSGTQYAELNCQAAGALYQDVLTVPGTSLNWQLYHRGRDGEDTMYLVIAPTNKVDTITTQQQLITLIEEIQRNKEQYAAQGYYLYEITDDNQDWCYYSSNSQGAEAYTVPDSQYLTRFFFVAGETAYDRNNPNSGNKYTIGNLLDDVRFTTELLPAQAGTANLEITKVVSGVENLPDNYSVTVNVNLTEVVLNNFRQQSDGNFVATGSTTVGVNANQTVNLTVTEENPPAIMGYNFSGTTVQTGDNQAQPGASTNVTLAELQTGEVTFTNTYQQLEPLTPEHNKYIKDNGDGTYDLSLNVTGTISESTETIPINVLYVLDESYSMMWTMDGDYPDKEDGKTGSNPSGDNKYPNDDSNEDPYEYSFERYEAMLDAMDELNTTLKNNSSLDVQVALVEFAGSTAGVEGNTQQQRIDWMPLANANLPSKEDVKWENFATGTNYGAAIHDAKDVLNKIPQKRQDAETVVIFITDGEPNRAAYNTSSTSGDAMGYATVEIAGLEADRFYAIGVGDDQFEKNLEDLVAAIDKDNVPRSDYFKSSDREALVDYFKGIAATITSVDCTNVVITDKLSNYAELVDETKAPTITIQPLTGDPISVTLQDYMADQDGRIYTGTGIFTDGSDKQQTLTYTYNSGTKTFTLEFPDTYALENGWTYTITVKIQPTDKAYSDYAANGYGTTVGDPDTDAPGNDTSSGKPGFYSNTTADLTYDSNGVEDVKEEYPKPVIQVKLGKLTLAKQVNGLENGDSANDVEFTFTVTGPKTAVGYQGFVAGANNTATKQVTVTPGSPVTLNNLPYGTYTVTEANQVGEIVNGKYYFVSKTDSATVDLGTDKDLADDTATITNTYAPYRTVTITKDVGGNMGVTTHPFNFTTSITPKDGTEYSLTQSTQMNATLSGSTTATWTGTGYTLADGDTLTISKLKDGDVITLKETDGNDNGYQTVYTIKNGTTITPDNDGNATHTVNGDANIIVTNERDVGTPTGFFEDNLPFTLMISAAGLAGIALIATILVRRQRRRRE